MFKKTTTYIGFDGEEEVGTSLFNMTQKEAVLFNNKYGGDIEAYTTKLSEEKNTAKIIEFIEDIILTSYGEKSEDGKRFIKNEEVRKNYSETLEFDRLTIELLSDENLIKEFIDKAMLVNIQEVKKPDQPSVKSASKKKK